MELRYGTADENVRKRSIQDVILRERQRAERCALSEEAHSGTLQKKERMAQRPTGVRKQSIQSIAVEPFLLCPSRAGELALVSAVNRLAAEGYRTEAFSPVIFLAPGTQESVLRDLVQQICRAAFGLGIGIGDVHAEVTSAVTQTVVVGTAAGSRFCQILCQEDRWKEKAEEGGFFEEEIHAGTYSAEKNSSSAHKNSEWKSRDIVMAGPAGLEGTCILVSERRNQLQERFPLSMLARMDLPAKEFCVLSAAETAVLDAAATMVSLGDGGFFTGLWQLSKKTGCGLDVDLQAVPVLQETIEITNELEINPYAMRSAGSLLIAARDGERLAERFRQQGMDAARIGRLTGGRDRILRTGEEIRYLDRPQTDALAQWFRENPR